MDPCILAEACVNWDNAAPSDLTAGVTIVAGAFQVPFAGFLLNRGGFLNFLRTAQGTVPATVMAIDPICQMTVDEQTALSGEFDGQTYYFCCQGCLNKFAAQHTGGPELVQLGVSGDQSTHACCGHENHKHSTSNSPPSAVKPGQYYCCLLYTSDAADE